MYSQVYQLGSQEQPPAPTTNPPVAALVTLVLERAGTAETGSGPLRSQPLVALIGEVGVANVTTAAIRTASLEAYFQPQDSDSVLLSVQAVVAEGEADSDRLWRSQPHPTTTDLATATSLSPLHRTYVSAVDLQAYDLAPGWNIISFPFVPSTAVTARGLCAVLDGVAGASGTAEMIFQWDRVGQRYLSHDCGAPVEFAVDFGLEVGEGYWVRVSQRVSWVLSGILPWKDGALDLSLRAGWNLIGLPVISSAVAQARGLCSAVDTVAGSVGAAADVFEWDRHTQRYTGHACGAPLAFVDDFAVVRGDGYFLRATADTTLRLD